MKYSITYLNKLIIEEKRLKYLFFWGHQPNKNGAIGASCFSQWWESSFEIDGKIYPTAEHWMMVKKAELFDNYDIAAQILSCESPAKVKAFGRKVTGFIADVWDTHKYEIVKQGTFHKFEQNESLKSFLLSTNDRVLVEASPVDPVWGIGLAKDHKDVESPEKWRGDNLLGFALMEVRDELL